MQNIVILSSMEFLFRFLPIFLIIYYIVPAKWRDAVMFLGSILFYAMGEPVYVLLLLGLTVVNYFCGVILFYDHRREQNRQRRKTEGQPVSATVTNPSWTQYAPSPLRDGQRDTFHNDRRTAQRSRKAVPDTSWEFGQDLPPHGQRTQPPAQQPARQSRGVLAFAVLIDAGTLALFKVLALCVDASLFPLGISFFIFKMISYQADLYLGKIQGKLPFVQTAAYFMMFPQVTQGPIMRYEDGFSIRQWAEGRKVSLDRFEDGLTFLVMGLAMKVLLADRLAVLWNEILKIGYDGMSTPLAWLGAYGYSFQLYYDFWGYSLMAAGVGMMLGYPFVPNFIHPYAATGIGDYYRRWHATLGSWFRDYVYIPLGGSRRGSAATIRNLLLVWLLTGLWHGGTLNYVIWGLVLGIIIILEKFVYGKGTAGKVIGRINVLVVIPLTWVIFALPDLSQLQMYFGRLFPFFGLGQTVNPADFTRELAMFAPYLVVGAALLLPSVYNFVVRHRKNPVVVVLLAALFWFCMYTLSNSSGNTFMYLNF